MDDYNWMLNACPATTPRGIVSGDSLAVVKRSGATGNNEVVCSNISSADLGYSYNKNIDLLSATIQDYPELDGHEDTIVVVWQDNRLGMINCYMSLSINGTVNLNGSISITDSTILGQNKYPDVAYSNGDIHLVYLDDSQHQIVYIKAQIDLSSQISEMPDFSSRKVSKIIDILGRQTIGIKNKPLIYIYDDGKIEKQIIID